MASTSYRSLVPFFMPDADEVNENLKVYSSGSEDFERDSLEEGKIRVWDSQEGFFVDPAGPVQMKTKKTSKKSKRERKSRLADLNGVFAGSTFETKAPEPSMLPLPRMIKM